MQPDITAKGRRTFQQSGVQPLDPEKLRNRRLDTGVSVRGLAGVLGVTPAVLDRLEHGARQNQLTLGFVVEYADALGVTVADLLHHDHHQRHEQEEEGHQHGHHDEGQHHDHEGGGHGDRLGDDDAAVLGAVLADVRGWQNLEVLAPVLGWTLQRAVIAADELAAHLPVVGHALAWCEDHQVQLIHRPVPGLADVPPGVTAHGPLRRGWTELLHRVVTDGVVRRLDGIDPKVLGIVRNAGLITTATSPDVPETGDLRIEGPRLTQAGIDALWLDESADEEDVSCS